MPARSDRNSRLFFHQVNQALKVRMPLDRALDSMARNQASPALSDLYRSLALGLSRGGSLSQVMARHPDFFSSYESEIVRGSEEAGNLEAAVSWLVDFSRDRAGRPRKLKANVLYLCLVCFVGLGLVAALVRFLVPALGSMYADFGGALPWPTMAMLNLNEFLSRVTTGLALSVCVLAVLGLLAWRRFPEKTSLCLSAVPILGPHWMQEQAMGFFRAMGGALRYGASLPAALGACLPFVSHPYFKARLSAMLPAVEGGGEMAEGLDRIFRFPKALVAFVRLGEADGDPAKAFFLATENRDLVWAWKWRKLEWVAYFAVVIILLWAFYVVWAMYMPIFRMASAIG